MKKKKKRAKRSSTGARVAHLKRLVGQHRDASNLGARGVVWALVAVCESLEAAIDLVAKPPPELAAWLGEDLSFDAYQLLKAWQELSESQIEEELQEAERLFGDKKMDTEVPELIAQATETFLQQLPALLIDHGGQWVGYCGRRRIAFGPTKRAVFEQCVAENIAPEQMLIRKVQPDVPVAQVTW